MSVARLSFIFTPIQNGVVLSFHIVKEWRIEVF